MRERRGLGLVVAAGRLELLDQSRLPHTRQWRAIDTVAAMVEAIRALRVRGAPMIAVAAALLVAVRAEAGDDRDTLIEAIETLRSARPTAVNLSHAMNDLRRAMTGADWRVAVVAAADALADRDAALCEAIGNHGAALIAPGERILTHCNTGALATAGIGTAAGVIRRAHEQGKNVAVWVDETRPLLQGARLTAWEFGMLGVPYTLITDSMAAALMARGQVGRVIVGADRIAANGDVANKIGTYGLAVAAHHHGIPFAVAAPGTTLDPACASGADIEIEQRDAAEVRGVTGAAGDWCWAPADAPAANPAFDVTPAALVTHWILDKGVFDRDAVADGCLVDAVS
ncbi:S-methyl-5-thioribose-1-phosphate isomerase [Salinisphaera sp.]|uniref:S-methyl-5-thioribose-1-phosphate isomerase n=1 Tax=Salinisphaera sp. TaxID=1914330 RepID=UPI002D777B2D|nr:S-methyl-5-thioribose-1-phosphate isomerase [Salinisphaera sp.]HET7313596.1 S-methyl-5-thioribose-1-phosphate isomerase [Salinisphaera sp.]